MSLVLTNRFKKTEVLKMFRLDDFRDPDSQNCSDEPEHSRPFINIENSSSHDFEVAMINNSLLNAMGSHCMRNGFRHVQRIIPIGKTTCNNFKISLFIMYNKAPFHAALLRVPEIREHHFCFIEVLSSATCNPDEQSVPAFPLDFPHSR
jgi:hypothetical protein